MALSLPGNPDLEHLRRDARRLQRAVRVDDPRALELVARHHPEGRSVEPASFSLSAAQLVVARAHGFASWPRLRDYLRTARPLWRDPAALDPAPDDASDHVSAPAAVVAALACLTYTDRDEPARWSRAAALLAEHPDLARRDVVVAATVGDAPALQAHLAADPSVAARDVGPFRWPLLLYVVYSRLPQHDAVQSAGVLLEAGADPDSGYLWQGLPTAFTALTGVFGEGESGPARQPRHPRWRELAGLLLARGADPNDRQALYNRMFNRDDSHLDLLLAHGLGRPGPEVWARRTGAAAETIDEMLQRQLTWARDHGFTARLDLLARHGFVLDDAPGAPVEDDLDAGRHPTAPDQTDSHLPATRLPAIHRAATPDAVRGAVAAGADVDARHDGRTALHQAALMGDLELVTALLDAGADPEAVDETHGSSALGWAEWARSEPVARLIRERRD